MKAPIPDPGPLDWRTQTANDALKAGWRGRLYWSTIAAVAVHAGLILGAPSWERPPTPLDSSRSGIEVEVVALGGGPLAPGAGIAVLPDPADEIDPETEEAEFEDEAVPEADNADAEGEGGGASESYAIASAFHSDVVTTQDRLDGLRRRASVTPELAEVEPEPKSEELPVAEDGTPGEDGTPMIEAEQIVPELEPLTRDEELALERLGDLAPELAFLSPSSWVLLRNPRDVISFLERRFHGRAVEGEPPGALSVALWIDERGSLQWAEINRSSGNPELDQSALELFTEVASFRPARERGVRVPMAAIFWLSYPW